MVSERLVSAAVDLLMASRSPAGDERPAGVEHAVDSPYDAVLRGSVDGSGVSRP